MTCNDCIKYDACLAYNGGMTRIMSMDNKAEQNCGHFKNKADFVEVVRCKDCKHCSAVHWEKPIPHTTYHCDLYVMSEIPIEIFPTMYDHTGYFYCALSERGDEE